MFYTFCSKNQRFIIEARVFTDAESTIRKINNSDSFSFSICSFEPSIEFAEISAIVPVVTTILYEDGTIEVLKEN